MFNWFNLLLAVLIGIIILFIVKAVRATQAEIGGRLEGMAPDRLDEEARRLAAQIRSLASKCPRCRGDSFALLGTGNQYKCHSCNFTFDGPDHMPA